MKTVWQRYRGLTRSERRDLLFGFVLIPAATVSVRLFGLRRWRHIARDHPEISGESRETDVDRINEARAGARMIEAASRYGIVRGNCLSRSVALWWLLRQKGICADIRIGARRTADGLEAHAWVETTGEILNDAENVRESFATFEESMASQIVARR